MDDPNIEVMLTDIEVVLTDESELHCFKLAFHVKHPDFPERQPLEIYLHTRQAFDLFHKLGERLMDYFARESADLLQQKMRQLNADRKREAQRELHPQAEHVDASAEPNLSSGPATNRQSLSRNR